MFKKFSKRAFVSVLAACGVLFASPAYADTSNEPKQQSGYTVEVAGVEYSPVQARKIWAACGSNDPASKPVRKFERNGPPGIRGTSILRCGHGGGGFHHIYNRHHQDWQRLGARVGDPQWRSIADFAIAQALKAPAKGAPTHNTSKGTWKYWTPLHVRDSNGNIVDTYRPAVVISGANENVITAFPAR
ncbi:hypothetical protein [Salinifilum ghardaiensis]